MVTPPIAAPPCAASSDARQPCEAEDHQKKLSRSQRRKQRDRRVAVRHALCSTGALRRRLPFLQQSSDSVFGSDGLIDLGSDYGVPITVQLFSSLRDISRKLSVMANHLSTSFGYCHPWQAFEEGTDCCGTSDFVETQGTWESCTHSASMSGLNHEAPVFTPLEQPDDGIRACRTSDFPPSDAAQDAKHATHECGSSAAAAAPSAASEQHADSEDELPETAIDVSDDCLDLQDAPQMDFFRHLHLTHPSLLTGTQDMVGISELAVTELLQHSVIITLRDPSFPRNNLPFSFAAVAVFTAKLAARFMVVIWRKCGFGQGPLAMSPDIFKMVAEFVHDAVLMFLDSMIEAGQVGTLFEMDDKAVIAAVRVVGKTTLQQIQRQLEDILQ